MVKNPPARQETWVPSLGRKDPLVKEMAIGKDSDAGRDWGQEAKGTTEDEMVG